MTIETRTVGRSIRAGGRAFSACLAVVSAMIGMHAAAQEPHRAGPPFRADTSHSATTLLRSAASHAKDAHWAEAIDIYLKVIQQFGDKMAELPKDDPLSDPTGTVSLSVDLRHFCQRRIAELPPEARALYRARVDDQAERWYRQGAEQRDWALLRRVVDQGFSSSWGDDALDLLGDLAYQDGRFAESLSYYRQLVPDRAEGPRGLVHPDPSIDLAKVAAKKILCRAAIGEDVPGPADIEAMAKAYPDAKGPLAGIDGLFATTLTEALAHGNLAPPAQADGRWPTFAGAPTRTKIAAGPIDVGSFQWKIELEPPTRPGGSRGGFNPMVNPSISSVSPERLLAYHPIIVGDQVIVRDDKQVVAYNLGERPAGEGGSRDGIVPVAWKHENQAGQFVPSAARSSIGVPRFTLTAVGDRIFARLGPPAMTSMSRMPSTPPSSIVALDRASDGKLLWRRHAADLDMARRGGEGGRSPTFEGTPVADTRGVYVGVTVNDVGGQTAVHVACLDADTGQTRWIRYVGDSSADNPFNGIGGMGGMGMSGPGAELGHRLLSLDGSTVFYQTNLGAVTALDAETGSIRWVAAYHRQERQAGSAPVRDLNPAIVHDGLVLVAPEDSPSILALDAATGRLVWKTDPLPEEVRLTHLLGVAKGRLIATGDVVMWFDIKTGKRLHTFPDTARTYQGFGRGILAGDRVYWPTRGEIQVLDQSNGLRTEPPIKLMEDFQINGGNLVAGDGYLIVTQADSMVVFCQNRRLMQRYREEIVKAPEKASNYYRLGRAAEAVGDDDEALANLALAADKAGPSEQIDGQLLAGIAGDHRHRLLMKLGRKARDAKDWAVAADRFRGAAAVSRVDRDALAARLELADVQVRSDEPALAVGTLQDVLKDERQRLVSVALADGRRTVRADLLVADRLAELLAAKGQGLYAEFDARAADLYGRAKATLQARPLEEIASAYPVATVIPDVWLTLAELHDGAGRHGDAARAYKHLLDATHENELKGRALWGLARAYEAQKLWIPARDALARLSRMPDAAFEGKDLAALASLRLQSDPFDRLVSGGGDSEPTVPLKRTWSRPEQVGQSRLLAAEGVPPSSDAARIFLVEGSRLAPIEMLSEQASWSVELKSEPLWAGYLADRLVVATSRGLVALAVDTGVEAWRQEVAAEPGGKGGANPFARRDRGDGRGVPDPGLLHGFRVVGDRIYCLRGESSLMAFDGENGLVAWTYSPEGARINPHMAVTARHIILQARSPNAIDVLDTESGRRLSSSARPEDEDWLRDPLPLDDDRLALVLNKRTIALFEVARGEIGWNFRESEVLPGRGSPRILGDAEHLLVLHDGLRLIRLDPKTGKKLWECPLGVDNLSERPEAMALDGLRLYAATDNDLVAVSLADGKRAWRRTLSGPRARWSVELGRNGLVAWPTPSDGEPGDLPVVFRSRSDGGLLQRFVFPVTSGGLDVRLATRGAVIASSGALWALGDRRTIDAAAAPR
ncbi:PQQ-binding-like beta-propeller repeat protein [Isosphaeraceae bacterium EP7]